MTTQRVSVGLPRSLFRKIEQAAALTHRSVEEVLATTVNAVLAAPPGLPDELAGELAAMHLFSDEALWAATQPSLAPSEQARLEQLNHKAGERPLTPAEAGEQANLLAAYYRSVLRRAQALAILAQRGHPLPAEIAPGDNDDESR